MYQLLFIDLAHMREIAEKQLMAELSRRNTDLITQWAEQTDGAITALVDIVLTHEENKLPQRAAWVLEKISERNENILYERLNEILKELKNIPSSSTRRTIAKVLMLHTIPEEFEGELLNFCIKMLENPKEPVAVKANCMTIVFNILPKYPDLKNEIFAIIENQIPYHSVGFKSRYGVLKRQLK